MNLSALFSEAFFLTGEEHNVEQLGGAQGTAGYSTLSSRSLSDLNTHYKNQVKS